MKTLFGLIRLVYTYIYIYTCDYMWVFCVPGVLRYLLTKDACGT